MKNHIYKVISYGPYDQQFAHLYKPLPVDKVQKKLPVVVVIHGGYWKDNHSLDTYATSAIVDYLQTFNIAIWNLEYRRMNAEGENKKAPWPATFKDVAGGIDHLQTIKDKEGLDLNRTLVIGHSAGGHLATWAASRNNISPDSELFNQKPLQLNSVISIAGILNLFAADAVNQPEQIARLMGGRPHTHPERYHACNPSSLNVTGINLTVVHGERDTCVDVSQARSFCSIAKGKVRQIILADADHFSMLPHEGFWLDSQWRKIKQLITSEIESLV